MENVGLKKEKKTNNRVSFWSCVLLRNLTVLLYCGYFDFPVVRFCSFLLLLKKKTFACSESVHLENF